MKKPFVIVIMFFLISINLVPNISADLINNNLTTIYVDDDNSDGPWDGTNAHPFQSIQDGIDATNTHDTVFIRNGEYNEMITIDKSINLQGEQKTEVIISTSVLDGAVLSITGNEVSVKDITIMNTREPGTNIGLGIYSKNNDISGIIIRKARTGILLQNARNNHISENDLYRSATTGVGIQFSNSYNNNINNNHITGYFHCIKINDCNFGLKNTIRSNHIDCQHARNGISIFDNANNFEISYNIISNISSTKGVAIAVDDGIHSIHHNTIHNCPLGIEIEYGGSAQVKSNTFLSVDTCVRFSILLKHVFSTRFFRNYWNEPPRYVLSNTRQ